jgi:hypothetical protein
MTEKAMMQISAVKFNEVAVRNSCTMKTPIAINPPYTM